MKVRLGDLTKIKTGKLDANASSPDGKYPFFTCAIEPLRIDSYSYDCECVLVAGNGDLNVKYYNGIFECFFSGLFKRLVWSFSKALTMRARVVRGSITSSIYPRLAA